MMDPGDGAENQPADVSQWEFTILTPPPHKVVISK